MIAEAGSLRFTWERANEIHLARNVHPTRHRDAAASGVERVLVGSGKAGQPGAERFDGVPGQSLGYRDAFALGVGKLAEPAAAGARRVEPSFTDGLRASEAVAVDSAATQFWVTCSLQTDTS